MFWSAIWCKWEVSCIELSKHLSSVSRFAWELVTCHVIFPPVCLLNCTYVTFASFDYKEVKWLCKEFILLVFFLWEYKTSPFFSQLVCVIFSIMLCWISVAEKWLTRTRTFTNSCFVSGPFKMCCSSLRGRILHQTVP